MSNKSQIKANFDRSLLKPAYLKSWLVIGILYLIVKLPYPVFYQIGKWVGLIYYCFNSRRKIIVQENIALCFPNMPANEQQKLVKDTLKSTGIAVFEVGMAWFWSDKRLKKRFDVLGYEHIEQAIAQNKNILVFGAHFLTIELCARMLGILNPGVGVYMKNQNPALEYIQLKGRLKSNKYMIDSRNTISMVKALRRKELLWYAPDQDLGARNSVFVPFFAVDKVATTVGTSALVKMTKSVVVPVMVKRERKGRYTLYVNKVIDDLPIDDDVKAATMLNQITQEMIMRAPSQYMWLHRRFKTRPAGEPSIYSKKVEK